LLNCGALYPRGGSKAAKKDVFGSTELGSAALAPTDTAYDKGMPAKAATLLNKKNHEELKKKLTFGGHKAFATDADEAIGAQGFSHNHL
jgi:hypothetical protein